MSTNSEVSASASPAADTGNGLVRSLPNSHPVMGSIDVALGLLVLVGVWTLLPARWWPVDAGGSLLGAAFVSSGALLLRGHAFAERVARVVASITLAIGLALVIALAYTVGNLYGLYGPIGQGGATLLFVVTLLLVPYLVVFPAAQLYFLLPRAR